MLVPVPGCATNIRDLLDGGEDALAVLEVVANVAGNASATSIVCVALIRYGNTDIVVVEDPVAGALETNLLIPVPCSASNVRNLLDWCKDAFSILKVVSNIAGNTSSVFVISIALIGNGDANVVIVEDPVAGALKASLLVPVPCSASDISNLLDGGKNAGSLDQVVANIAAHTGAVLVISIALIRNWDTDSVVVENPVA